MYFTYKTVSVAPELVKTSVLDTPFFATPMKRMFSLLLHDRAQAHEWLKRAGEDSDRAHEVKIIRSVRDAINKTPVRYLEETKKNIYDPRLSDYVRTAYWPKNPSLQTFFIYVIGRCTSGTVEDILRKYPSPGSGNELTALQQVVEDLATDLKEPQTPALPFLIRNALHTALLDLRLPENEQTLQHALYREEVIAYLKNPVHDHIRSLLDMAEDQTSSHDPRSFLKFLFEGYKDFCKELFLLSEEDARTVKQLLRPGTKPIDGQAFCALCDHRTFGLPGKITTFGRDLSSLRHYRSDEAQAIMKDTVVRALTELLKMIEDLDTLHVGALCVSRRISDWLQRIAALSFKKTGEIPLALAYAEGAAGNKNDRRSLQSTSRTVHSRLAALDTFLGQTGSRPVIRFMETYANLYQELVNTGSLRGQFSGQCRTMEDVMRQIRQHVHIPSILDAQREGMTEMFNNIFYILGYHVQEFRDLLTNRARQLESERNDLLGPVFREPVQQEILEQCLMLLNTSLPEHEFRSELEALEGRSLRAYNDHLAHMMHQGLLLDTTRNTVLQFEEHRDHMLRAVHALQLLPQATLARIKNVLLALKIIDPALKDLNALETNVTGDRDVDRANTGHILGAISTLEQLFADSALLADISAADRSIFIAFEECVKMVSTVLLEQAPERTAELVSVVEHVAASIAVHHAVDERTLRTLAEFANDHLLAKDMADAPETMIVRNEELFRFAHEHPVVAILKKGKGFYYKHHDEHERPLPAELEKIMAEAWDLFRIDGDWLVLRSMKKDITATIVAFADDGADTPYEKEIDLFRLPANYTAYRKSSGKELRLPRYNTKQHRNWFKALATVFRTVGPETHTIAVRAEPLERFGVQVLVKNVDLPQVLATALDPGTADHVRSRAVFYTAFLKNVLQLVLAPKEEDTGTNTQLLATSPAGK